MSVLSWQSRRDDFGIASLTIKLNTMKKITFLALLTMFSIIVKAQSVGDYIEDYAEIAQELGQEYHIPASIILGVAIHESAAGKSKIARHLNNHFGFKGKNSNTDIRSAYKDFPTVDSSYSYFVSLLKRRSHFNSLFDKYDQYDYKGWAEGIHRGGYASSNTWATQVVAIINKYELYEYDDRPDDYVAPAIIKKTYRSKKKSGKTYTVKKGDTLGSIAKRNGTTVTSIKSKSGLKSNTLQPGQKLKI